MKVKFLIIRFSSIGDIVLTSPIIRCLKQQVEGSEIHYLTKRAYDSVVSSNPYVDKVHLLQDSLKDVVKKLKEEEFDYIIDLHHNLRSLYVKKKLKVLSFSFNKINIEKWLMVAFKINRLPDKHIVDRYFNTLDLFDINNDKQGLDFFIEPKNEIELSSLPSNFQSGYIALVIGAKHATKKLLENKLVDLCKKLNYPAILLGGPEDKEAAEEVIKKSNTDYLYNACGKYNLQQSASLVRQAKLVITHDTGLMHIAAAFKKKIISIWGNTIPQFGMYPYLPGGSYYKFEVDGLKCRPCSKLGYQKCPKKHFYCMNNQDIDGIVNICRNIL